MYGKIAREGGSCGCAPSGCCGPGDASAASLRLGYTAEDLAAVPEGADLGLGCGNPQAIAALREGETVLADVATYTGCIAGAALVDEVRAMLDAAGFVEIELSVKEQMRAAIADWFPGTDAASYVASASIEARKPGASRCCAPGCCA